MLLMTQASRPFRWRTVNATDNGFPSRIPRSTLPPESPGSNAAQATSPAVIHPAGISDGAVQNLMGIAFYGAGSDTNTFSARLIAWKPLIDGQPDKDIYVPVVLFEVAVALSTPVGLAGRLILNTDRFADTITLTGTTAASSDVTIRSPANDTIACLKVDVEGAHALEMTFTTGGSATSCNALAWMY